MKSSETFESVLSAWQRAVLVHVVNLRETELRQVLDHCPLTLLCGLKQQPRSQSQGTNWS